MRALPECKDYASTSSGKSKQCGKKHCGIGGKTKTYAWLLKQGIIFITVDLKQKLLCLLKRTGKVVGKKMKELAASPWGGLYADLTDGKAYRKARSEHKMRGSELTIRMKSKSLVSAQVYQKFTLANSDSPQELPPLPRLKNLMLGQSGFKENIRMLIAS